MKKRIEIEAKFELLNDKQLLEKLKKNSEANQQKKMKYKKIRILHQMIGIFQIKDQLQNG